MKKLTYCSVKLKGRKDGRNWRWRIWLLSKENKSVQPPFNQLEVCDYEKHIRTIGDQELSMIDQEWKKIDQLLKPEFCIRKSVKINAEEALKKESKEEEDEKPFFEKAKKDFFEQKAPSLNRNWMLFWLLFVGVAEFPLNSVAFQILGASAIETYIMSASLCFALPFFAHQFGKALRQDHKMTVDIFLMIISPIIVFSLIAVLAIFREKLFEGIQNQNIVKINLDPNLATVLFVIINLAVFFVATLISFEGSHKNHEEFTTLRKAYKQALKRYNKESKEAKQARKVFNLSEKKLNNITNKREKQHEIFMSKARNLKARYESLIFAYRYSNIDVRSDGKPICFNKDPEEIKIPLILSDSKNLDWNCN